jgi:hypothetical protein
MPAHTTLTVLHCLRLTSVAGADAITQRSGLASDEVEAELERSVAAGLVRHVEGRLTGWTLTTRGRGEGERLLNEELELHGARRAVESAHREFVPLNTRLLEVCTDWQVVRRGDAQVPNDHADPARDVWVLERLTRLHADSRPLLRRLGSALVRFADYEPRLARALELTLSGDDEWFTRPTIDSYHTVWFELHEDLLATLGRQRVDERTPGRTPLGETA